jgi:hypothetical protein
MRGKRALTSFAEHRLRMKVQETCGVLLVDGCFPNRA